MSTAKIRSADTVTLVRSLRDLYQLTQEQFAAKLGVSLVTINRWENDRAKPTPLALRRIQALLIELSQPEPGQPELNQTKPRQTKSSQTGQQLVEQSLKRNPEPVRSQQTIAKHLLTQYFPEER